MLGFNGGLMGIKRDQKRTTPGLWFPNERSIIESTDRYWDNVSLLLHMDGSNGSTTFSDSSSKVFTVTANGNAQISTAQSKFGGASGLFDGTGDYLTVPFNSAFEFGTGDFTVETWVRFVSINSGMNPIIRLGEGIQASPLYKSAWSLVYNSSGILYWYGYNFTSDFYFDAPWSPSTATWYHIAVCRSGSSCRIFVNGSQIGSTATSADSYSSENSDPLYIGRAVSGPSSNVSYSNFYIDDIRITKGISRYNATFTPPTAAFPNG